MDVTRGVQFTVPNIVPSVPEFVLIGDQSIALGNRASHYSHEQKTILPQCFSHLVAPPSDTRLS